MSDEHRRRFIKSQGLDPDAVDHNRRRERAFAVLDEWGADGSLYPGLRIVAALRGVLERHFSVEGVCAQCYKSPCPDESDVLDALVPDECPECRCIPHKMDCSRRGGTR